MARRNAHKKISIGLGVGLGLGIGLPLLICTAYCCRPKPAPVRFLTRRPSFLSPQPRADSFPSPPLQQAAPAKDVEAAPTTA